jgi:formylglycine-generating enzyme required for sulfatase activity
MKHVNEPVPNIRQVQKDVPDELATIVEKALAKDRNERYQTALRMAADLKAIDPELLESDAAKKTISSKRRETVVAAAPPPVTPAAGATTPDVPVAQPIPPVQPARNRTPMVIAAVVVVLLFLAAVGGFLAFSWDGDSDAETQGVTVSENQTPTSEAAGATEDQPTPSTSSETQAASTAGQGLPSAQGMVRIPAGTYTVGLDPSDNEHATTQQAEVSEFWIDQRETTNAQYADFLAQTDHTPPTSWADGNIPAEEEDHPVKGVTWDDAMTYCDWANKRLPTEAEWEIAARGPERRLYPWGDNQRAVELPRSGTYKAGGRPTNQSSFGVFDMAGNVWEWVGEPYAPVVEGDRILRGGANGFLKDMAYRLMGDPTSPTMIATAGIRCAADQVELAEQAAQSEGVLYEDSFIDPGSGWPILAEENRLFGYHPPDFYHVEVAAPNQYTAISRQPNFDDTTVEAEVQVDHTDTESGDFRYGLALRRMSEDQFYAFTISARAGKWFVLKSSADGLEVLAEGEVDTLRGFAPQGFTPETPDILRVDAGGDKFVFHINGEPVVEVADSDYTSGEIGFFVENFDETLAHIHYDSLTVREAELAAAPAPGLLYEDQFADLNSGWLVEEGASNRVGYHPPDFYHVEVSAANERRTVAPDGSYGDATVETELFVDFTDTEGGDFRYGLLLRRMAEDQFYAFTVSSRTGQWYILKSTADGLEVLEEGPANTLRGFAPPGFSPDTFDHLRVDASGDIFVFHINGEVVAQVSDADYASGEVGFYVETFDETLAHVHYDSLLIREVDTEAISMAPTVTPEPPTPAPTEETIPTATAEPPTPAPTEEAVADTLPAATAASVTSGTGRGLPENMVLIPTGNFLLGSDDGEANEVPEHQVFLDAFLLDKYEATNVEYRACVEDGGCSQTSRAESYTRSNYRDDPKYDHYPVVEVTWDQAAAYCEWTGKRLPTEAEWEYAASGPTNLAWPWGNSFDPALLAAGEADTVPVASYPDGASPFGIYNMAGNVNEWVQDVFDETFYSTSAERNPISSGDGDLRIFRGGSFDTTDGRLYTTSRRYVKNRSFSDVDIGFRCALDVDS